MTYRRFRKVANSAINCVTSLCLSVRLSAVSQYLTLNWFVWNLVLRTSIKICGESPDCLKSDKNIENYTRWSKYVLLLPRRKFAVKTLLCDTKYFYIVDRDVSSMIHTKCILALRQSLNEGATKLLYAYISSFICNYFIIIIIIIIIIIVIRHSFIQCAGLCFILMAILKSYGPNIARKKAKPERQSTSTACCMFL